jgi:hypothetical protein
MKLFALITIRFVWTVHETGNQIIIFGSQENESKNEAVSDDYFDQYIKTGQTPINKPPS